jgi:hypothetical protein
MIFIGKYQYFWSSHPTELVLYWTLELREFRVTDVNLFTFMSDKHRNGFNNKSFFVFREKTLQQTHDRYSKRRRK